MVRIGERMVYMDHAAQGLPLREEKPGHAHEHGEEPACEVPAGAEHH